MDVLNRPLRLPCGATLPNRLAKAAMTEGLADAWLRATPALERLYRTWSEGGCGLLSRATCRSIASTSNGRPTSQSTSLSRGRSTPQRAPGSRTGRAPGQASGNALWVQLSHAGRQTPRYVTGRPVAPSAVQLDLLGNYARPRALTEDEILGLIGRFAHAAQVVRDCGFSGVQVHGAHGYLISSFLSPVTNQRTDAWGGPLVNRARFLLETLRAVRRAVGDDFPVALKLNSDDFRKGGFTHEDCLQVVAWLNDERVDLLEVSGGTYEQPRLIGFEGRAEDADAGAHEHPRARSVFPGLRVGDPQGGPHAVDGHGRLSLAGGHDGGARRRTGGRCIKRRRRPWRLRRDRTRPAIVLDAGLPAPVAAGRDGRDRRSRRTTASA